MAPLQEINAQRLPWDNFEVLSLDIFDTTLARLSGHPESVFQLLESRLISEYGNTFKGFAEKRSRIDATARRKVWERRNEEEIQLIDIYACLAETQAIGGIAPQDLCDIEQRIEEDVLYGLEKTRQLIVEARKRKKKVIFLSDMYLSKSFISERLKCCGFNDYDHLFVSSAEGCLKWSGKLYKLASARLNIPPRLFFHLGDNPEVDGKKARMEGWQSCIIAKPEMCLPPLLKKLPFHSLQAPNNAGVNLVTATLISKQLDPVEKDSRENFWFDFGFDYAAPLYYGFLRFILAEVQGRGIKNIYFLSRDGYFIKKLYDRITKSSDDFPKSQYLYASRRGLRFPAIEKLDQEAEDWLVEGINLTVGDFFERMGMSPGAFSDHIHRYGFRDENHIVCSGFEYDALRRLFREIEPSIIASAKEERECYLEYLRQKLEPEETFVMVDVGWNASLQAALENIFRLGGIQKPIHGLYLGTYPRAKQTATSCSTHTSFLLEYGVPESRFRLIRSGVALIEFLFAAPETTFLRMARNRNGAIEPLLHSQHENAEDLDALHNIQAGAEAFFDRIKNLTIAPGLDLPAEFLEKITDRWLVNPTRTEARKLSKIAYPDGWGAVYYQSKMADHSGFWKRAVSPKKTKAHFKSSHWRPGYNALLTRMQKLILKLYHPAMRMDREL